MASSEEIKLIISSEMSKATTDLKKLTGGLQDTQKSAGGLVKSFVDVRAVWDTAVQVGRKLVDFLGDAISAASDLEEQTSKFNTVFGTSAEVMESANNTVNQLTNSYAMSEREARQYMSSMQDLLVPLGILPDKAVQLSSSVVKLAADLGSFNNLPTAQVMGDIQSALVGNFETMKKYGVVINETVLKQEAYNLKLWDGKGQLDASAKAQAAFNLSLKGSSFALGDMERTQDSWANTMKAAAATAEDFMAAIGTPLKDALLELGKEFGDNREDALSWGAAIGTALASVVGLFTGIVRSAKSAAEEVGVFLTFMEANIDAINDGTFKFKKYSEAQDIVSESAKQAQRQEFERRTAIDGSTNSVLSATAAVRNYGGATRQAGDAAKKAADEQIKAQSDYSNYIFSEIDKRKAKEQQTVEEMLSSKFLTNGQKIEIEQQYHENVAAIEEEFAQKSRDRQMQSFQNFVGATQQVTSQLSNVVSQYYKNKDVTMTQHYNKEKKKIEESSMSEEEKKKALDKLEEDYQKKRADMQYKQAVLEKKIALVSAIQNTATAVSRALTAGPIAGPILATVIGALGAAQIALIARQPIPKAAEGALIKGSSAGSIIRAGEGGRSEAIIPLENPEAMSRLGGMGNNITINIQNAFADSDFPREMAQRIDAALYDLKRRGLSRVF